MRQVNSYTQKKLISKKKILCSLSFAYKHCAWRIWGYTTYKYRGKREKDVQTCVAIFRKNKNILGDHHVCDENIYSVAFFHTFHFIEFVAMSKVLIVPKSCVYTARCKGTYIL